MSTNKLRKARNWITLTPLRIAVASVLALAMLATAGAGVRQWIRHRHYCAAGVFRVRAECVGVTDGSFVFGGPHSQLASVEQAIHRQNLQIAHQSHVTIALLVPLADPDPAEQAGILHEVQGAYVAQAEADDPTYSNSAPLKIRLVLANPGIDSSHWAPVVKELAAMKAAPDNLRAVFGIAVSMAQTEAEVRKLTKTYGIAVVTSAVTANGFANRAYGKPDFPGLARVSASDRDEAAAITRFAGASRKYSVLVEDNRQGDTRDYYTESLYNAYLPDTTGSPYPFTSAENESNAGDVQSSFARIITDICAGTDTRYIYFAARQVQLRIFVNQLTIAQGQECRGRKFTVITGDAAAHLVNDSKLKKTGFASGGITLDYPAIATPEAWRKGAAPAAGSKAGARMQDILRHKPAGPVDLRDGGTIVTYDAALTAITGIRGYYDGHRIPAAAQVGQGWSRLMVNGASGTICLSASGNPYDKAINIMQMSAKNSGFVATVWPSPTGNPLGKLCNPPRGT